MVFLCTFHKIPVYVPVYFSSETAFSVPADFPVLSELWVLQEKVGMKVSAFSLTKYFLFLGIYGIIELSKDERR